MILGDSPHLASVQGVLQQLKTLWANELACVCPQFISAAQMQSEDCLTNPVDLLVLIDHMPFAGRLRPPDQSPDPLTNDLIRQEAQHAIRVLEFACRASRKVALASSQVENWPGILEAALDLGASVRSPEPPPWNQTDGVRDAAGESLVEAYLEPLFSSAIRPDGLSVAWPRECFIDGDEPGNKLPAIVEVAGRARILAYGPYLPLPRGKWNAIAYLGFSPDIGKLPFILEVDTGSDVSRGFFEVVRGGLFTLNLSFGVSDPYHPVEFRLISQESALEGQLSLIGVNLTHLSD